MSDTAGKYAALCPVCLGCGKTSRDQMNREVPQPRWTDSSSTAVGWRDCSRCAGSGVIVINEINK